MCIPMHQTDDSTAARFNTCVCTRAKPCIASCPRWRCVGFVCWVCVAVAAPELAKAIAARVVLAGARSPCMSHSRRPLLVDHILIRGKWLERRLLKNAPRSHMRTRLEETQTSARFLTRRWQRRRDDGEKAHNFRRHVPRSVGGYRGCHWLVREARRRVPSPTRLRGSARHRRSVEMRARSLVSA